jgi:hypothetical protein
MTAFWKKKSSERKRVRSSRKSAPNGAFDEEWSGYVCMLYYRDGSGVWVRCTCQYCHQEHRGSACATKPGALESVSEWISQHGHQVQANHVNFPAAR